MALQIRRGPNAQRATTLLQTGEIAWTTDTKKLYVGDGVTTGGVNILANIAGTGFVWNPATEQLDLAGSTITGITADNVSETPGSIVPRIWYRSSLGKQHASEIFTTVAGAAHTGISFSWDDVNQKLTATVLTENAQDTVAGMFTSGQHTGISFTYGLTQDAANRIDATVDAEYIQDQAAALFSTGVHTGITFTYSDNLNAISAAVTPTPMGGNLASNLSLNSNNITGTGAINITGTVTSTDLETTTIKPNGTNSIQVGTTSGVSVFLKSINSDDGLSIQGVTTGPFGSQPTMSLAGQRGTLAAPAIVQNNDPVGTLIFRGYTGTNSAQGYAAVAFIGGAVFDSTSLSGKAAIDGGLILGTPSDVANNTLTTLSPGGKLSVKVITVGAFATTPSDLRPTGVKGMIIFNDTSGKFQGYTGSAWVDLS